MRIFAASIFTETNSFSPVPTTQRSFEEGVFFEGTPDNSPELSVLGSPWKVWGNVARKHGFQFTLGLVAFAEPSGVTTARTYANLRSRLLDGLRIAMPVDIVLLALHGAMMAQGLDDTEGDILAHVRSLTGPDAVIAVLIDPHAHLTDAMVTNSNLITAFGEWPHTDVEQRAEHIFDLAVRSARHEIVPISATFDCWMIGAYPTQPQPMRGMVDQWRALEKAGLLLSVSLIHGYPWGDCADVGAKMLTYADNDKGCAQQYAKELGSAFYKMRDAVVLQLDFSLDQALSHVEQAKQGLIVLCDAGDNVPGGGTGDTTFFLQRARELGVRDLCFGPIWDPMATAVCMELEVGARIPLRIGGKAGRLSGNPFDATATLRRKLSAHESAASRAARLGDRVWVTLQDGMDVILHSSRANTTCLESITDLGLDPRSRKAFVGKMLMHGGVAFAAIAAEVRSVATPGAMCMPFSEIPLSKISHPWWPKVADPLSEHAP
jgi:microcystin degradation protein MlrC